MNEGQLSFCVRAKEGFVLCVNADEGWEKFQRGGREVHHVMRKCARGCDVNWGEG